MRTILFSPQPYYEKKQYNIFVQGTTILFVCKKLGKNFATQCVDCEIGLSVKAIQIFRRFNRKLLVTTLTELSAMAAPAIMGLRCTPAIR